MDDTILNYSEHVMRLFMSRHHAPFCVMAYDHNKVSGGDSPYWRCTILLPVDSEFALRGGIGLSSNVETAKRLACLHGIDVLCALNIPVFENELEQRDFCETRRKLGLLVPSDRLSCPTIRSPPWLPRSVWLCADDASESPRCVDSDDD